MMWQQQLRDWLSDWWEDFWRVSPRHLLIIVAIIIWATFLCAWRTGYVVHRPAWPNYYGWWPLRLVLAGAAIFFARRLRRP